MTTNTETPTVEQVLFNFLYMPRTVEQIRERLAAQNIVIADIPRAIRRLRSWGDEGVSVIVRPIADSKPRAFTYEAL